MSLKNLWQEDLHGTQGGKNGPTHAGNDSSYKKKTSSHRRARKNIDKKTTNVKRTYAFGVGGSQKRIQGYFSYDRELVKSGEEEEESFKLRARAKDRRSAP